jgi:hypothetical protein
MCLLPQKKYIFPSIIRKSKFTRKHKPIQLRNVMLETLDKDKYFFKLLLEVLLLILFNIFCSLPKSLEDLNFKEIFFFSSL